MNPMLVLLRLIAFSPKYFARCAAFAILLFAVLPIPLGFVTRAFFDAVAIQPAGINVWSAVALLVALQIGEALADPIFRNPWNSLQQKSHVLLQHNLFAGMMRGYGRFGVQESIGETISRFRDDPLIIGDGLDSLCDLIGRSFFFVGAAVVMWQINATMTMVLFAPLLLSTFALEALGTTTERYRTASRMATSRLTGFLGELLAGQLALKVANAAPFAVRRMAELGDTRRKMAVRDSVYGQVLDSLSVHSVHLGTGLVLLLAAQAIRDGTFSVGDFALFVVYLDQLVWYPSEIARLITDLKRIQVSYGRMHALVPGESDASLVAPAAVFPSGSFTPVVKHAPPPFERLDVRGLTSTYFDGTRGIENVSFSLRRGSFTVITGRIGSGKSTLVHVLLGLLARESGEIWWNGRLVDDPATFFVPPRTAFTPQVPRLFSESMRDNILLGERQDSDLLQQAVKSAVLERDVAGFEDGLDTLVGPRGVKLSGGQVQRVAAARMFVRDAELLVFDDLSSALDAETEAELWSRLFSREREVTCLVVSHRPLALRRADQVLVMENGRARPADGWRASPSTSPEIAWRP